MSLSYPHLEKASRHFPTSPRRCSRMNDILDTGYWVSDTEQSAECTHWHWNGTTLRDSLDIDVDQLEVAPNVFNILQWVRFDGLGFHPHVQQHDFPLSLKNMCITSPLPRISVIYYQPDLTSRSNSVTAGPTTLLCSHHRLIGTLG